MEPLISDMIDHVGERMSVLRPFIHSAPSGRCADMVDYPKDEPRYEWDDSMVLRRLVARAWTELACTNPLDQPTPAGEREP